MNLPAAPAHYFFQSPFPPVNNSLFIKKSKLQILEVFLINYHYFWNIIFFFSSKSKPMLFLKFSIFGVKDDSICLATIVGVHSVWICLRLDGEDGSNDFWRLCDDISVRPVGFVFNFFYKEYPFIKFPKILSDAICLVVKLIYKPYIQISHFISGANFYQINFIFCSRK